jgi:hypothetical protein
MRVLFGMKLNTGKRYLLKKKQELLKQLPKLKLRLPDNKPLQSKLL